MKENCPVSCSNAERSPKTGECKDLHERCEVWARLGECKENPKDMNKYCPKSCGVPVCEEAVGQDEDDSNCVDNHKLCSFWASKGECSANSNYMHAQCPKSCNSCEKVYKSVGRKAVSDEEESLVLERTGEFGSRQKAEGDKKNEILQRIQKSIEYMKSEQVTTLSAHLIETCQNRHDLCSFWSVIGEVITSWQRCKAAKSEKSLTFVLLCILLTV